MFCYLFIYLLTIVDKGGNWKKVSVNCKTGRDIINDWTLKYYNITKIIVLMNLLEFIFLRLLPKVMIMRFDLKIYFVALKLNVTYCILLIVYFHAKKLNRIIL